MKTTLRIVTVRRGLVRTLFSLCAILFCLSASATVFTVSNLTDAGTGSLRQAILNANAAGNGPHTIQFTSSGTILLASGLPALTVSGVTIDGGNNITLNAQGGDIGLNIFTLSTGANSTTLKNMILENTGTNGVTINAALSGVTIQNIKILNMTGNYIDYGIYVGANIANMTVKNVTISNVQNGYYGMYFAGTITGFTGDSVMISGANGGGFGMRLTQVVNNFSLRRSTITLTQPGGNNAGYYGIYLDNTATNFNIDSVTIHDARVYGLFVGGQATHATITNSTFDLFNCTGSAGGAQMVRFNNGSANDTLNNLNVNCNILSTTDDGDYGIVLEGNNQTVRVTNCVVNQANIVGIYLGAAGGDNHDNITISNNTVTNCGLGGGQQGGILFFASNQTSDGGPVLISSNTFTNNNGEAIDVYGNNGTFALTNFSISQNTITGTQSTNGPIRLDGEQNILITQNSIYSNASGSTGILLSGSNCSYAGTTYTPTLSSSTKTGTNTYQVKMSLPAICSAGCSVELFASDASSTGIGGRYYVNTFSGVVNGTYTANVTTTVPPAAGSPYGIWTATLRIPSNTCGTSQFSNQISIQVNGPAGVNTGVNLWVRPDQLPTGSMVTGTGWTDVSGNNKTFDVVTGTPSNVSGGLNYNNYVNFNGSSYLQSSKSPFVNIFQAGEVISVVKASSTTCNCGNPYDFGGSSRGFQYTWGDGAIYDGFGTDDRLGWNPATGGITDGKAGVSAITGRKVDATQWNIFSTYSATNNWGVQLNGQTVASTATNNANFSLASNEYIGAVSGSVFNGGIAEEILYNRTLSVNERMRINTYLGIKYGLTLGHDYIASDSTTVLWSMASNVGNDSGVAGIARDDLSQLTQRESYSVSQADVVTVALGSSLSGTNYTNTGSIANDRSALMWGNNNSSYAFTKPITNTLADTRMSRVWRIQKTNWSDETILVKLAGGNNHKVLLVSTDSTFLTGVTTYALNDTGAVVLNSSSLPSGAYFTFASQLLGPAAVTTGIKLWYRADDYNATVSSWGDFSNNDNPAVQATTAYQPAMLGNAINYNPAFYFNGTNQYLQTPKNVGISNGNPPVSVIFVASSSNTAAANTPIHLGAAGSYLSFLTYTTGNLLAWDVFNDAVYTSAALTNNTPFIASQCFSGSSIFNNVNAKQYLNGVAQTMTSGGTPGLPNYTDAPARIGFRKDGVWPMLGDISEMIVYNRQITTAELQQVQSYLSLKYGITLNNGTTTYLASDGVTKMWDATANAGYISNIAGIGRDSVARLTQKQSKSVNTGSLVALGVGSSLAATNGANVTAITNNLAFLSWGDNNGSSAFTQTVAGTQVTLRMPRVWKIYKNANWADQMVSMNFSGNVNSTYLIISNTDPTFGTINQELALDANGNVSFNSALLANGAYFTFAKAIRGPGYVNKGIAAWYRGDVNLSSAQWNDNSGNAINLPQSTTANQPIVITNGVNYNPVANFTGTQFFGRSTYTTPDTLTSAFGATSLLNIGVFGVVRPTTLSNGAFFEQYTNNANFVALAPAYTDGNTYWDAPYGFRINAAWGGTLGQPYIYSGLKTATAMNLYRNRVSLASASGSYNAGLNGGYYPSLIGLWGGSYFNGVIGEVVAYSDISTMSANDRLRIESYMAIKYGISLDQTVATNYLASDSSVVWNATANSTYKYRVTGIARDDKGGLYQKQSINSDTTSPGYLSIGVGVIAATNTANTSTIGTDKSFLLWGDDNTAGLTNTTVSTDGTTTIATGGSCVSLRRLGKTFKVQNTGTTGVVQVQVHLGSLSLAKNAASLYLAINTTNTFGSTVTKLIQASSLVSNVATFNNVDLTLGQYFTVVGQRSQGPAGIVSGLRMWMDAVDGVSNNGAGVQEWDDQSAAGVNVYQATAASQPVYNTSSLNFNPALNFNGSNQWLQATSNMGITNGNAAASVICVANSSNTAATGTIVNMGTPAANYESFINYMSGNEMSWDIWGEAVYSAATLSNYTPFISTQLFNGTGTFTPGNATIAINDVNQALTNAGAAANGNYVDAPARIGMRKDNVWPFLGNIGELLVYNRKLTGAETQKINSYLAIKYGISLGRSDTANYVASDGTVIWNATNNVAYKNHITGIGRDDCSALLQKQSRNNDTSSKGYITMGVNAITPDNASNAGVITTDKSFLLWGDDSLSGTSSVAITGDGTTTLPGATSCTQYLRLARTYKVAATGSVGTLELQLNTNSIYMGKRASDFYMAINNVNSFAGTVTKLIPATSYANNVATFDNITFTDGQYFTIIGPQIEAPGNVANNLSLWLRPDSGMVLNGTTVQEWDDQGPAALATTQTTVANQPTYVSNGINYYPTLSFNGSSKLAFDGTQMPLGTTARTVLAITRNSTVQWGTVVGWGDNTNTILGGRHTIQVGNGYRDIEDVSSIYGNSSSNTINAGISAFVTPANSTISATSVYYNGLPFTISSLAGGANAIVNTTSSTPAYIGICSYASYYPFTGQISEVIVYNKALTTIELSKVQSYLALKYGITLDQTTPTNYVASDGTVIWTGNSTYKDRITGIGRDDCGHLAQMQSANQDTVSPGGVTMALGTLAVSNAANTNVFAADRSFLMWADDSVQGLSSATITGDGTISLTGGSSCVLMRRLAKTYHAQVTGTISPVQVVVNLKNLSLAKTAANIYLAINTTNSFSSTVAKLVPAASLVNGVATFNNVDFTLGQYFTVIGQKSQGPANITSGLRMWMDAQDGIGYNGTGVAEWDDQSAAGVNNFQTTAGNQPGYSTTALNFNPALTFNGSNQWLQSTSNVGITNGNSPVSIIAVASSSNTAAASSIVHLGPASNYQAFLQWVGSNYLYFDNWGVNYRTNSTVLSNYAPFIISETYNGGAGYFNGTDDPIYLNGVQQSVVIGGGGTSTVNYLDAPSRIGMRKDGYWPMLGNISELLVYNRQLTSSELKLVNSYLSIKYGVSLSRPDTSSYVASDGTVIWNATANVTYKNRVTGIGRDDCSALLQYQSKNSDTTSPGYVTIARGAVAASNVMNPYTFASDKSFLMWGDDSVTGISATPITGDGTITLNGATACSQYKRLGKTYKVAATGSVGKVQVQVNLNSIGLVQQTSDLYLAINSSNAFTGTVTKLVPVTSFVNNVATFDSITFSDGQYFTVIGQIVTAPANVASNLAMWLKADAGMNVNGTAVTEWDDQGPSALAATQATAVNEPTYVSNGINFLPTLSFNGSSTRLLFNGSQMPLGNTARTVLAVTQNATSTNYGAVVSWGDQNASSIQGGRYTLEIWSSSRTLESENSRYGNTSTNTIAPGVTTFVTPASSTPSATSMYFNGATLANTNICCTNTALSTTSNATAFIGANTYGGGSNYYAGNLSEVIVYNQALNATDLAKVQTYLAIKYGITLNQGTPTNYVASDGTVIWTGSSTYKARITGIGRDDCGNLLQKQSVNQDTASPGYLTVGLGSIATLNSSNTNTFAADKSFMIWADDSVQGLSTATISGDGTTTLNTGTCAQVRRLAKTFKMQITGTSGLVQVTVNLKNLSLSKNAGSLYLAINSTSTFSGTVTKLVHAASLSNGIATFNNVDFSQGQYFTIVGQKSQAPANITSGLRMWMDAQSGIGYNGSAVNEWDDQGPAGINNYQTTATNQPGYSTTAMNFNPALTFNGSNQWMMTTNNMGLTAGNAPVSMIYVASTPNVAQTSVVSFLGQAATGKGYHSYINNTAAIGWDAYNDGWGSAAIIKNYTPFIGACTFGGTTTFNSSSAPVYYNGVLQTTTQWVGSVLTPSYTDGPGYLGVRSDALLPMNGNISELLIYNRQLTGGELKLINSYLAIKYGVSLSRPDTSNYWASDGTVIWNATTNATYKNRVTGIGRDDCSALLQYQSRNNDTSNAGFVTVGLGTVAASNVTNTSTFATDKSFLMWGDDSLQGISSIAITGDGTTTLTPTNTCTQFRRMAKTYKVQVTGSVGSVEVQVSLRGLALTKNASDLYLVINNSNVFSGTVAKLIPVTSYINNVAIFDNVNLSNGQYFTVLGQKIEAPANIATNIGLWLKATDGVTLNGTTVSEWDDQSVMANNALQTTAVNQPTFVTSGTNFNPALSFNGTSNWLNVTSPALGAGNISYTVLAVAQPASLSAGYHYTYVEGIDATNERVSAGRLAGTFAHVNYSNDLSTGTIPLAGKAYLMSYTRNSSTGVRANLLNDLQLSSGTNTTFSKVNSYQRIGNSDGTEVWDGTISEVLVYGGVLAASDVQKLNTYLAVKYGLSLDQTTPTSYVSSDGTVIWDASLNSAYTHRITGIGREDCYELGQLQSLSQDSGIVTMAVGTGIAASNAANVNVIPTDKSYLFFSDNNLSSAYGITVNTPTNADTRMSRRFRVSRSATWTDQNITFGLSNFGKKTYMLTSTDTSFNSGVTVYTLDSLLGTVTINSSSLPDGIYFTFATRKTSASWIGVVSSDWNTLGNWDTTVIPNSLINTHIIGTAPNMPIILAGTTASNKNITVDAGASVTVVGGTLNVAGTIYNSGTIDGTQGTVGFNGTTAQTIPANTFVTNTLSGLTINNSAGVSLGGAMNITGVYTPTAGVLATNGNLVLKSTGTATASVAQGAAAGGYISGSVTVERYIPANSSREWRLLSVPTQSTQTIQQAWQEGATSGTQNPNPGYGTYITCTNAYSTAAGFDAVNQSTNSSGIKVFDQPTDSWATRFVTNTNTKLISSEPGYFLFIRGDRTCVPANSTITPTTLRTTGPLYLGDQAAISVPATKYAVVGNPFASSIDFSKIASADRTNMNNKFWLWDPQLNLLGGYQLFDPVNLYVPVPGGGSFGTNANSVIGSGQAFYMQAASSAGSLVLREGIKTAGSNTNGFKTTNTKGALKVQMERINSVTGIASLADGALAMFDTDGSDTVGANDATKPVNVSENLAISKAGSNLMLDYAPMIRTTDTIHLQMWQMYQWQYRFKFVPSNFNNTATVSAYLVDAYKNTMTPVSLTDSTIVPFETNADSLSMIPNRFNVVFFDTSTSASSVPSNRAGIITYPNPVSDGILNVKLIDQPIGEYQFTLLNTSGQIVKRFARTRTAAATSVIKLDVEQNVASGNYLLEILLPNHIRSIQKVTVN